MQSYFDVLCGMQNAVLGARGTASDRLTCPPPVGLIARGLTWSSPLADEEAASARQRRTHGRLSGRRERVNSVPGIEALWHGGGSRTIDVQGLQKRGLSIC